MSRNHPGVDPKAPHNIDHGAYAEGTPANAAVMALEDADPFWITLGGSTCDPFGDGGETFAQRQRAVDLGLGLAIYGPMGYRKQEA